MPTVPRSSHSTLADVADDVLHQRPHVRREPDLLEHLLGEAGRHREPLHHQRDHPRDVGVGLRHRHAGLEPRDALIAEVADEHFGAVEARTAGPAAGWCRGSVKPAGSTPMISCARPSIVTGLPITPGRCRTSAPSSRAPASPAAAPSRASSSAVKRRPSTGWTRSTPSAPSVTTSAVDPLGLAGAGHRHGGRVPHRRVLERVPLFAVCRDTGPATG